MTIRFLCSVLIVLASACAGDHATTKKKASAAAATSPAPPAPKPAPVVVAPVDTEPLPGTDTLYFEFNSATLSLDDATKNRLTRVAAYLVKFRTARVVIEGHADERGTSDYNLALGEQRARAAVDYLLRLGVRADQVLSKSYGEEKPAVTASDEAGFARNRRDEIRVMHGAGAGG